MSKLPIIALSIAGLVTFGSAHARTSSDAELRGYNNCMKAAKKQTEGLVASRQYYVQKEQGSAWYYINATQWQDGERATARIACETTLRGHKLVSSNVEAGHFAHIDSNTLSVAKN